MATIKIETEAERDALAESGDLGRGALLRDPSGEVWLAYDGEDGPYVLRPWNEEEERRTPACTELYDLPLPLYVTTEEN